jgi:hypothetical protein
MKKSLITVVLTFTGLVLFAQENEVAKSYAALVSPVDLKEYLTIIASDALEGRKTGSRGQKMAAAFIADHFKEIGLTPTGNGSFYQPVELFTNHVSEAWIKTGTTKYDNFGEVFYFGSADSGGEVPLDVVFLGKGTDDDYKQVDIKDKAVVILTDKLGGSRQALRKTAQSARDKGAKIVMVLSESTSDEFHAFEDQMKGFFSGGSLSLKKPDASASDKGTFFLNQPVAAQLFNTTFEKLKTAANDPKHQSLKKIKPGKASYSVVQSSTPLHTENIAGYLEGTDKKDEVVLVTAHYDHIGINPTGDDRINNGADDDGSGTVSVLEIAKSFAKAKEQGHGPRRSMLFMTVVGEEQGLFGSEYYVENPIYPLANTVVDLNIDMIGRTDAEHKGKGDYVYIIGSDKLSTPLHELNERMNKEYTKMTLDYTYNDENHPTNLYKRSDHWNFAKNGIPIIFYFDGIHEDYHKPTDEVSKIEFDLMAKRAQLVFYSAWEIANREDRIVADKK